MTLIQEYTNAIIENLPEWNHSSAKSDETIQIEIHRFKEAASKIDTSINSDELLHLLADIIEKYVPDNHVSLKNNDGKNFKKYPFTHEQDNLSFQNLNDLGLADMSATHVQEEKDPWIIGTIPSTKTGVIAIPSFGGNIEDQIKKREQFINTFFEEKKKHQWQNIVFDLRGNTGGDAEIIKEIAERMSGMQVKYADKSERVDTPAAKKKKVESPFLRQTLQHARHYQSSSGDKFLGSIYILQNEYNASAAEGAIYMLSQLPKSTTIGEKTSGTFAGGATTTLPMSYGSLIIGTEYRERFDKNGKQIKEKEGMVPDIPCSSENAFSKAMNMISEKYVYSISKEKSFE